ncbi:MAG: response regulator transcription factor [Chloroflexi bacterium]|nr:response regulator transcription factor [Chloroflexota bacterium]
MPTRVLLADDHAVVRAGLRNALMGMPNVEVVGEAGDGQALLESLARLTPELLVVDVAMPNFDPVKAVLQIKSQYPAMRILIVSAYDDEAYVTGLLGAGVDGYHLKDQPLADLQLAVQRVLNGERWISGPLVDRLVHRQAPAPVAPRAVPQLTRRQRELLRLLTQGYDNRKIAQAMDLSVKTVENHLTTLYRALGVESRLAATTFANQNPEVLASTGQDIAEPEAKPDSTLTVLVVDDNTRYRQQLTRLIGKTYPSVLIYEAEDIAETLRLAERVHPHLALLDVVLHDEDGIQCARRLKALSPNTRVVLISAYPDREFRRLGLGAGAVAFLDKKDIDSSTVRQVLDDALGSLVK